MRVALLIAICHITGVLSHFSVTSRDYKWILQNKNRYVSSGSMANAGFIGEQKYLVLGIRAPNSTHVVLYNGHSHFVSLVIGYDSNTAVIFSNTSGTLWATYQAIINPLHPKQYRLFWLDWSDGHYIKLGTGLIPGEPSSTILSSEMTIKPKFLLFSADNNTVYYRLPKASNPCFINYYTFLRVENATCSQKLRGEYLLPSHLSHLTVGFVGGQTSLLFQVRGAPYGDIVLSTTQDKEKYSYHLRFGGRKMLDGTIMRLGINGRIIARSSGCYIGMSKDEYRWFWVDWSDGITIKAGVGSNPNDCKTQTIKVDRRLNSAAIPRFFSIESHKKTHVYKVIKAVNQCYLNLEEYNKRRECRRKANEKKCLSWGCCWDDKEQFCYEKKKMTSVSAQRKCFQTIHEHNNRVQCGPMRYPIHEFICVAKGCCWDSIDRICFYA